MKTALKKGTPGVLTGIVLPAAVAVILLSISIWTYLLPTIRETMIRQRKESIRLQVQTVLGQLSRYETMYREGRLTEKEARQEAMDMVRELRYGKEGRGYFWLTDLHPVLLVHPYRQSLEETDVTDYRDEQGTAPFARFVQTARDGGGFVSYSWQSASRSGVETEKISYVAMFRPWGWVLGTGVHFQDIHAEFISIRTKLYGFIAFALILTAGLTIYVVLRIRRADRNVAKVLNQRERLIAALKQGEERYRTIADFAYDWELWLGPDGEVNYCSPSCERITGKPPEAFFERPEHIRELIVPEDRQAWDEYVESFRERENGTLDFRIKHPENGLRWLSVSGQNVFGIALKPLGIRFSLRDVTDSKTMEEQLRHQALHDPLTGLANRNLCIDRIRQAMERSKRRDNHYYAVVFLDLDKFKLINDSLGHHFGDMVLRKTAHRLISCVRSLDTVARFGGDEFVLLLDELAAPGEAIRIVKRVRRELSRPYHLNGHDVSTSGSIGIVLSPTDYERPEDLLQNANIAMHRAKESGRNNIKAFTNRMLENAVEQMSFENDMRKGLRRGEFHVEYQPILLTGRQDVIGFEALARWTRPNKGITPPTEFIPVAEETGLIDELGLFVLDSALATLASIRKASPEASALFMAVNVSPRQFSKPDFFESITGCLQRNDIPGNRLKIEITESAIMNNPEHARRILNKLKHTGVMLSIDDFGTGYSSLTQLQHLPVDTLKIDRSFIDHIETDKESLEIVRAIIALAHSLSLDVVAEGVEERPQLDVLKDLDCESVQGFLLHSPMATEDAKALVVAQGPLPSSYLERLTPFKA